MARRPKVQPWQELWLRMQDLTDRHLQKAPRAPRLSVSGRIAAGTNDVSLPFVKSMAAEDAKARTNR